MRKYLILIVFIFFLSISAFIIVWQKPTWLASLVPGLITVAPSASPILQIYSETKFEGTNFIGIDKSGNKEILAIEGVVIEIDYGNKRLTIENQGEKRELLFADNDRIVNVYPQENAQFSRQPLFDDIKKGNWISYNLPRKPQAGATFMISVKYE